MKGQLGQHFVAIADFSKAIELKPDYAIAYYNRGLAKRRLKQYADAIKDYSKATEINPDFVEAYYNRGIANYALDRTHFGGEAGFPNGIASCEASER